MAACAQALIGVFKLSGNSTLDYFFGVFNGNIAGQHDAGIFGGFYKLCLYSALAIIFISMIYQIFKAFFGPLASAETPSRVVFKSVFYGLLAANAQNLVAFVFDIAQIPFDAVSQNVSPNLGHIAGAMGQNAYTELNDTFSSLGGAATALPQNIIGTILSIILFFMLFKNFLALALELGERYLILGLLTIIAPLCIACGAVRGLEEVFKNWLSWVINGCIVMIFTTFFLAVFIVSFVAQANIPYLILWIAWFKTGQKIDEHMNALGLKTAKSGGFGMDVMSSLINGTPAALGAYNKLAGTNFSSPLHKFMGRPDGSDPNKGTSLFNRLGLKDPSTGNGGKNGVIGAAFNNAAARKIASTQAGQTASKALQNAGVAARKAANTTKHALMGSGVGQDSGLSHSQLKDIASGKVPLPNKKTEEFNNVMRDMARMQGGEEAAKWLNDNKGMKITDAEFDKNGNMTANATDGTKSAVLGFGDKDIEGAVAMDVTGDDGQNRQLKIRTDDNEDNRIDNSAFNPNDSMRDDKSNVVGATDDTMVQNGTLETDNGTVTANSEALNNALSDESLSNDQKAALQDIKDNNGEINFNEEGLNENGSLKHFDSDGNESETGDFVKDANGTLIPNSVVQEGNDLSDENNVSIAEESKNSDGEDVKNFNNIQEANQEGLSSETGATVTGADGNTYNLGAPDENGIITGTDSEGNTAQFKQEEDGSLTNVTTGESGLNSVENSTVTDNNGNTYSLSEPDSNGIITGTDSAGNTAQFKQEEDGSLTKIGEAREFDQSKGITTNENGESIAYDSKTGEAFKVSDDAMHDTAKDIHGDTQNVDASKGVSQISSINSDGTTPNAMAAVASLEGDAGTAQFNANNANITMQNSDNKDFQVDTTKGLQASMSDGGFNVTATDTNGNTQSITGEGTKLNIAGHEVSSTAKVTDNNDGTYSTTNTRGEQVSFTGDQLKTAGISATTDSNASSLNTTKTADLSRVESMTQDINGNNVSTSNRKVESISTGNGDSSTQRATATTNTLAGNSEATFDANKTNAQMVNSEGKAFDMDTSKNMSATLQPSSKGDGTYSFAVSATDTSGQSHNLQSSATSLSINGHEVSGSSKIESLGNGTYKTTDVSGNEFTFKQGNLDNSTISATTKFENSSVNGTPTASSTMNSSQFRNEKSIDREPVICKSSDNQYFLADSTQRYDRDGKLNPNGEYLKSSNSDGIATFQHVGSGEVATYKYAGDSNQLKFGTLDNSGKMEWTTNPSSAQNIKTSSSYVGTSSYTDGNKNHMPTGVMSKEGNYQELYDSTPVTISTTKGEQQGIQRFCRSATSNEHFYLDMQKNKFDESGHLMPSDHYYVHDEKGNARKLASHEIDGGTSNPTSYVRVKNDVSGGIDYRKMGNCQESTDVHMVSMSKTQYANGINTSMDLSKTAFFPVSNENGTNNGQLLLKYGNEQYHFYPKGTDVSAFSSQNIGCPVTLPGGQQGYIIPDERNTMNVGLSNFGIKTNANREYSWGALRNLPEDKRTFLRNMGVNEDAQKVRIQTKKDGTSSIIFESNNRTYCFKNSESRGYQNVASSGYSITGHPASYKYELSGKTTLSKLTRSSTRKAFGLRTPISAKRKNKK